MPHAAPPCTAQAAAKAARQKQEQQELDDVARQLEAEKQKAAVKVEAQRAQWLKVTDVDRARAAVMPWGGGAVCSGAMVAWAACARASSVWLRFVRGLSRGARGCGSAADTLRCHCVRTRPQTTRENEERIAARKAKEAAERDADERLVADTIATLERQEREREERVRPGLIGALVPVLRVAGQGQSKSRATFQLRH